MNKYPLKELGHGIEIKHGFAFKGEFFSGEGEKIVLTPGNFYDEGGFKYTPGKEKFYTGEIPEDYICSKGDLIVAMTEQTPGLLGSTALVPEDEKFLHNQRIGLITLDNQKYDKLFLNYLFRTKSVRDQIALSSSGTKVKHTSPKRIYEVLAPKPPLDKQQKIGALLHSLDSKIELNNKINAELEAMAKLIYDYWFVQFDFPISKAQAAAIGKPELEGKPYKASGGPMVYNKQLKREIPEGWEVKELGQIESNIVTGKTPSTKEESNFGQDIPFICIGDVRGNMHVINTEIKLSKKGADSQGNKYIPKGAICVTCIASPGLVAFATEKSQTNQQLNSIVCQDLKNRYFLYFYLKDYFSFAKAKTGNTFANMNKGDFSSIKSIHPSSDILVSFSNLLEPSIEKIENNSKENQKLSALRDWLLPMLMNGQVSIKEAEEYADSYRESMAAEPEEGYGK
ncbi:MAG: restriction endonuclease subunit S [Roseivirga sp.]|jgi:type I restriction enzyme S subunit|uniref:restriction endonuclease subunit S n=1 Tax=Roseivirga sp. TaxID=1964215 RepID=UPI001B0E6D24|nr:restriction endonuclease subunit S [Roseivirga sp.]MBO6494816.1 restriction endonuclease subunit S [Roseivirga sp.]